MAKIDITSIEGYENMTPEQKLAALENFDIPDPDYTGYVKKDLLDRATSEAAGYKKQLREKMTQEEQAAVQAAEAMQAMRDELESLRRKDTINDYTKRWMGVGYDENLATATAQAMISGDLDTVFKNHSKFLSDREKTLKAELLKGTPAPPAGDGTKGVTREDVSKMNLADRAKFAKENPEIYKDFYGGN